MKWSERISDLAALLQSLSVTAGRGSLMQPDAGFSLWKTMTLRVREQGRRAYLIGNGASASMASHFAADLEKNCRVLTEVFTDCALVTALANDLTYEEVFSEPLRRKMVPGDMLVAISSSGRSPNILRAARTGIQAGGTVVTLSAMDPDNPLRGIGGLNFYLPARTYGLAETAHAVLLHLWLDLLVLD